VNPQTLLNVLFSTWGDAYAAMSHHRLKHSRGLLSGRVSRREEKGKITQERRHFVSSLPADPDLFAKAVRSHWGIENSLHYVLDVTFGEDNCRIRTDKGPENMSFIRKIALTIARCDTESKSSVAGKIKQMAWSESYLEQLLFSSSFASKMDAEG
jgi:predicted transposase YbfD/YdcC